MPPTTNGLAAPGIQQQIGNSATLLGALDAASKWPAFLLLSGTFLLSVISTALFGAITVFLASKSTGLGAFMGFVSFLVVSGIALVGMNAAGILLSDEVWGRHQRGMVDAILAAAFSFPRLLGVLAIEFLLFIAFLLVLTLLLFVCKIPGLGPVLYAVVMPVGVIATGLVIFALAYIAVPLAAPAIWNGASVKHALLMLQAVARKRLLTAVVMMVLLGLLAALVVGFVWGILGMGALTVFSLSGIVLGVQSGGMDSIMQMFVGGGGSGYAYAMGFGGAVLMLVGANPGILIALKGSAIIYREVSAGLSLEEDEAQLNRRMQDIKARAEAARQQAQASMQQPAAVATPAAAASVPSAPAAPAAPAMACPACQGPITSHDVFCGNCGHKLK
jgi:MFS family permease